jgi:hypothetical protein
MLNQLLQLSQVALVRVLLPAEAVNLHRVGIVHRDALAVLSVTHLLHVVGGGPLVADDILLPPACSMIFFAIRFARMCRSFQMPTIGTGSGLPGTGGVSESSVYGPSFTP